MSDFGNTDATVRRARQVCNILNEHHSGKVVHILMPIAESWYVEARTASAHWMGAMSVSDFVSLWEDVPIEIAIKEMKNRDNIETMLVKARLLLGNT